MTKKVSFCRIVALALFFCVSLCPALYGQQSSLNNPDSQEQFQSLNSEQNNAVQVPAPYWNSSENNTPVKTPSTFGMFVKMVFSLLVVIGLAYLVVRFFKKTTGIQDSDESFLRKVAQISIGGGKTVQIVTLLDRAYLIGVSDNSVNLLSEISDKELVESLNLLADKNQNTNKPKSFADVLEIFVGNNPKNKSAFSDNARHMTDLLKQQRNRFNKGE